ncbi:MAG: response regulator transcription factor [Clostridia bacterium]|nr:response regulator transcription factor [Clostridia bacterium]
MKTILIADDEQRIRRMLTDFLKSCGYQTMEAKDGQEAIDIFYANNSKIDCIILDVMMPHRNGLEVLSEIREISLVPVIMLTAKSEEYDQLAGFKAGADDYITKPFSPTLLVARLEAVLKRCGKSDKDITIVGDITIDETKKEVKYREQVISLTPKEFELLSYFALNEGVTLSREQILNSVWNYDYCGGLRTVDTHVKQLRAKLKDAGKYIHTIYSFGYRFEEE